MIISRRRGEFGCWLLAGERGLVTLAFGFCKCVGGDGLVILASGFCEYGNSMEYFFACGDLLLLASQAPLQAAGKVTRESSQPKANSQKPVAHPAR